MTQEEKNKLYKYLCAVLPYNVKVSCSYIDFDPKCGYYNNYYETTLNGQLLHSWMYPESNIEWEYIKPHIRPMESMTKEEFEKFNNLLETSFYLFTDIKLLSLAQLEWLNKNHFDYMRLIDDDLAIDKTKENNFII